MTALVVALWTTPATARESYITNPGAAAAAVAELAERVGREAATFEINIAPDTVTLLVQGSKRAHHIDQWQLKRHRPLASDTLSFERITGPQPVQSNGIVTETETGFFGLEEIALDRFNAVLAAALERAALEEPGQVTRVKIARRVSILPKRAFGRLRWAISISSGRESATVYTNPQGEITHADLENTERARRLNLFGDDWPDTIAARELAAVLGGNQTVYEVGVNRKHIAVETEHPTDKKRRRKYLWNLSGVRVSFPDMPFNPAMKLLGNAPQPFRFAEADLARLKQIKPAALKALGVKGAKFKWITARNMQIGAKAAQLHWEMRFTTPDGEEGRVITDPQGNILKVVLPPSLRPQISFLDPAALPDVFARIGEEFSSSTRFIALHIWPDRVSIRRRDPENAKMIKTASLTQESVTTSAMQMPAIMLPKNADFKASELSVLSSKVLKRMVEKSLAARIGGKGAVSRLTVERGNTFVRSPNGKLTVTVWLAMPAGTRRVTFASTARVIDVTGP